MRLFFLLSFSFFLIQSCSLTKKLEPGQKLYTGTAIKISETTKRAKKKQLTAELLDLSRPKPNSKLKLRIYNFFKPAKKEKGLWYWISTKIGEPPVIFSVRRVDQSHLVMEKHLRDQGYLDANVQWDTIAKGRKMSAQYNVALGERTMVENIIFTLPPITHLDSLVLQKQKETLLKSGQAYRTEVLSLERQRLAELARQNGYFRISSNDVYFYVDTSVGHKLADIYVRWREDVPRRLSRYRHGSTEVQPTYSLNTISDSTSLDTINYENLRIVQRYEFLRSKPLRRFIHKASTEYFDDRKVKSDLTYLQNVGVFKFVNVDYQVNPADSLQLDIKYQLTPRLSQRFRLDMDANSRTGNFLGTSISGTYNHANIFGGAEDLEVSLSGGLETQLDDTSTYLINTLETSAGVAISLPFLMVPFFKPNPYRQFVARTRFSLDTRFQQRQGFFSINSSETSMRYDWRSSTKLWHQLSPLSISQIIVFQISDEFKEELELNPRLAASFEDAMIWSGKYRIEYSSYLGDKPRPHFFGLAELEVAGNLLYGISSLGGGEQPYELFTVPFSQFVRVNLDYRYYYQWTKEQAWVFRANAGIAIPYLNSETVPYARQFFAGGANSIRAFRFRQLGPGAYVNPNATNNNFFDQTGDIKLEFNAEYRFDLSAYFEGAAFLDAGNIWLLNETLGEEEAGAFSFNNFIKEMAIGTGLGFRIDLTYFIIRLDASWPIRQPLAGKGFQWTVKDWDFGNPSWRKDNIRWHLAIGYPF